MEFTGERMILGTTDKELETEHLDRYRFAEQFVSGKTVLDAACGSGYGTKMLAGTAENVTGIDISKEAIEYAGMLYKADNISYVLGTVSDLPFPNMSFDVVVSFETIEHIDRDTQILFLDEIKRIIKREGILPISTCMMKEEPTGSILMNFLIMNSKLFWKIASIMSAFSHRNGKYVI